MSYFSEKDIDRENEGWIADRYQSPMIHIRREDGTVWVPLDAFRALAAEASALGGRVIALEERIAAMAREKA